MTQLNKITTPTRRYLPSLIGICCSLLTVATFIVWVECDRASLLKVLKEDGPVENLTAVLFGLSALFFTLFAIRSDFLRDKKTPPRYLMTTAWVLLMVIFTGEEISWGQRLFHFSTPETLSAINVQHEFNIHNLAVMDMFMGGKYRWLSIMMLSTGLLLPILAATTWGKKSIQRFAFPVPPLCLAILFVGAYGYGRYYHVEIGSYASEVREFLLAAGMLGFALYGTLLPEVLFRCQGADR